MNSKFDLMKIAESLSGENVVVDEVNDHCLRIAVNEDSVFDWHYHPNTDEMFLVLAGELTIEFESSPAVILTRNEAYTVPSGLIHRTKAKGRTVNLCFELAKGESVKI